MWRFLAPKLAGNHTVICVDLRAYRKPARVHGICEEYRAAATIDVEHDRADKEASKQIECPMLHLWAEGGSLDTFYTKEGGSLGVWRQWAPRVEGQAMKGGHFFPEEKPDVHGSSRKTLHLSLINVKKGFL
jgi:pimeloyl-ACP methyl ester carboxylesterase